MRRFLAVITLVFLLTIPSFALTNTQYNRLVNSSEAFARANIKLNRVYLDLRKTVSKAVWKVLSEEQMKWINWVRDEEAEAYMDEGYTRADAYTKAINDRTKILPKRAKQIEQELSR